MDSSDAWYPPTEVQKIDEPSKNNLRSDSFGLAGHLPTSGGLEGPALLRPKRLASGELEAKILFSNECVETYRFR